MNDLLKQAGKLTVHINLLTEMRDLRSLLHLAAHMQERADRVTLVAAQNISLIGTGISNAAQITTSQGVVVDAQTAFQVLCRLKQHAAAEYAVTYEELVSLNTEAVRAIEHGPALQAFGETLGSLGVEPGAAAVQEPAA